MTTIWRKFGFPIQPVSVGESRASLKVYGATIGAVAIAALVRWLLDPIFGDGAPLSTFIIAVIFCTWYAGLRSATFAMFLGFIVGWVLFVQPHVNVGELGVWYFSRYAMYFVICSAITGFGEATWIAREISEREISERKQAETAARESNDRFRQLADAMPQIVWTATPDGNVDYLNHRWTEFTGFPQTASNEAWSNIIHPDEFNAATERWEHSVATGSPFEMELRLLDRQTNSYRWFLLRTVAVVDPTGRVIRWFGTGTDIHEQTVAAEKAQFLAKASAALAGIVDYERTLQQIANLAVPFFADWSAVDIASEQGNLRRLAVSHREIDKIKLAWELGETYLADSESSRGISLVFRTGIPELVGEITDQMLVDDTRDERHLELVRSLGLKSFICVPLIASSQTLGVLTFATAESRRTYSEHDLILAKDLAHRAAVAIENTRLYQALRDADRRKDEFLATLSHELRNPLAPIRNALQILNMAGVDEATSKHVREVLERQTHHLVRLIDDLMDVSRVMRGKIELRKEFVELSTIVERAIETVQPLIDAQKHQLKVSIPRQSLMLHVDPVRMAQVVGNLLANSAKYTDACGLIELTAERDHESAVLKIRDNGIGIAREMLTQIFELFVQADHHSARSQGGLGVGLTLVKNLVEMHGGSVRAKSSGLGQGSEFIVQLPLASVNQAIAEQPENGWSRPINSVSGRRLLVVDDNKDAANSLAMLLKLQGHEVRLAHDGSSALDVAQAYRPEMVFLDIGMPGMDGYEVARRMRQLSGLENTVLTALTGWGQQEDRRRTTEAGFNHHLVKPPDPEILERVLAELAMN